MPLVPMVVKQDPRGRAHGAEGPGSGAFDIYWRLLDERIVFLGPQRADAQPPALRGFQGQQSDIAIHAAETLALRDRLTRSSRCTAGSPRSRSTATWSDRFFTPHEAVQDGLIDRVLNGNGARGEA